jgi:hypothetical protein
MPFTVQETVPESGQLNSPAARILVRILTSDNDVYVRKHLNLLNIPPVCPRPATQIAIALRRAAVQSESQGGVNDERATDRPGRARLSSASAPQRFQPGGVS